MIEIETAESRLGKVLRKMPSVIGQPTFYGLSKNQRLDSTYFTPIRFFLQATSSSIEKIRGPTSKKYQLEYATLGRY